ncbi:MAG: DUF4476 domain-containing protein [Bacteroidales bacterium]|nr:DUF4476 domain-containing protein [Bacteroidales bacterium]
MKKLIILLSVVFVVTAVYPQSVAVKKPMGRFWYNCLTKRVESPKRDERRMKKGVRIIKRKNVSSNQLYKLSLIFQQDEYRLGFVKGAYPSVTDKSNAIILCDAFEKFSHQTIMWEYIKQQNPRYGIDPTDINSFQDYLTMRDRKKDRQYDKDKNKDVGANDKDANTEKDTKVEEPESKTEVVDKPENANNQPEVEKEIIKKDTDEPSVAKVIFPNAAIYTGINKGCENYLNDKQFVAFANTVAQFEDDEEKAKICMEYVYTYCFTTEQVMKLGAIIKSEPHRYIFFKTAYPKVYDKDNFLHVKQILTTDKFIHGINEIYEVPSSPKPHGVPLEVVVEKCILNDQDFSKIKSEIRKESFSTAKLEVAKRLVKQYECIGSAQVKDLLPLFSLETDKIDFAKFAYPFTTDPKNYNLVRDYFTSQSGKNAINTIMNE